MSILDTIMACNTDIWIDGQCCVTRDSDIGECVIVIVCQWEVVMICIIPPGAMTMKGNHKTGEEFLLVEVCLHLPHALNALLHSDDDIEVVMMFLR